jgi:membrane protease YdiL (CAAX protease family)
MTSVTRTLRQRIPIRTALLVSAGWILLRWLSKAVTNTYYIDRVLGRISSLQGLSLTALANGIVTVASVTLLLYLSGETYRDIGFHRRRLLRQLGLGFLFGTGIFVLDTFAISPVAEALLPETAPAGIDMGMLFARLAYLPIMLAVALFKGGFTEELWRIFGLTRFERLFGRAGLVVALIASSIVFGLGHVYQGLGTALAEIIQGLLYALVYLRKRSAWEVVCAHAVYDLIAVTLGFLIYAG